MRSLLFIALMTLAAGAMAGDKKQPRQISAEAIKIEGKAHKLDANGDG